MNSHKTLALMLLISSIPTAAHAASENPVKHRSHKKAIAIAAAATVGVAATAIAGYVLLRNRVGVPKPDSSVRVGSAAVPGSSAKR